MTARMGVAALTVDDRKVARRLAAAAIAVPVVQAGRPLEAPPVEETRDAVAARAKVGRPVGVTARSGEHVTLVRATAARRLPVLGREWAVRSALGARESPEPMAGRRWRLRRMSISRFLRGRFGRSFVR